MRKKDDHNKKTSHLIIEMSMNEAFIWLSGHRFIDRETAETGDFSFGMMSLSAIFVLALHVGLQYEIYMYTK